MMVTASNDNLTQRMKKTTKSLFIWTSLWVLSLALLTFGPVFLWDFATGLTVMALLLNLGLGFNMIMANKRHLESLDELQRRIHLNAMAISLGVSMVFGAAYGVLEAVKLISFSPNPSNILFFMGISYILGVFIGFRKYQ